MLALLADDTGLKALLAEVRAEGVGPGLELSRDGTVRQGAESVGYADRRGGPHGKRGGAAGDPGKLRLLKPADDFSHHRACALALELIGDPSAAKPLAELLRQEGMMGHVHDTVQKARERDQASPGGTNAEKTRRDSLCELLVARALYRCGDYEGLGEQILRAYTGDLRGHLARHAQAVLDAEKR